LTASKSLNHSIAHLQLIASIERLQISLSAQVKVQKRTAKWGVGSEFERGDSSIVRLTRGPEVILSVVKFSETTDGVELIKREAAIHKELKHPLLLEFRESKPGGIGLSPTIVTEVAGNGSLGNYLQSVEYVELRQLRGEIRIARIIVGIVLAMRYLHSQKVIHCNLNPNNILLDWDWNVRIGDFGHSISSLGRDSRQDRAAAPRQSVLFLRHWRSIARSTIVCNSGMKTNSKTLRRLATPSAKVRSDTPRRLHSPDSLIPSNCESSRPGQSDMRTRQNGRRWGQRQ
jgi:serine/threonine protein kinase